MNLTDCVFCNINKKNILLENDSAFVIEDKCPHTKGHILVIPFNHVENYFDLSLKNRIEMNELLYEAKKLSDSKFQPEGYNIIVNIGKPAGQIIMHTHIHLIPRYLKN